jgi:hypothetical protein
MNVGNSLKHAFNQIFRLMAGPVVLHRNFGCSNLEVIELMGLKNKKKDNGNSDTFEFPDKIEINVGDLIHQKESTDHYRVYKTEDHITAGVYICLIVFVKRSDLKGNLLE